MAIKEIDFLSPKITLYYYGSKRHKSLFGTIMSLIMVILSSIYIFYLFYSVAKHKISNFMFYKTYLAEAGNYAFNDTTGIYHFFQVYDIGKKEYGEYNPSYIRIIMSRLYKTYQYNYSLLSENEHWVYDKCREGEDNRNVHKDIFGKESNFYKGACLRYYYNIEKKEYFPIEDKNNFKFPYLIHGSSLPGSPFLETIVEKCDNSSITHNILGPCGTEIEIRNYIHDNLGIFLQILEKQVITNDYENPIHDYISGFSGAMDSSVVPVNNINIAPFHIEIKKGIVLPRTKKIITYFLEENRREYLEQYEGEKILAIYDYWLQNWSQQIKGGYSTLYDILPSIGGIIQLIYYIFYCSNYLYNNYIIIHDCNKSFFRNYNSEDAKNIKDKKIFLKYLKSIRDEAKFKYENQNFKCNTLYNRDVEKNVKYINPFKKKIEMISNNRLKLIQTEIYDNKNLPNIVNYANNALNLSNSNDLMNFIPNNKIYNNTNNIKKINNKKKFSIFKDRTIINDKIFKKQNEIIGDFLHESDKMNNSYFQFSHQLKEFINHKRKTFKIEPLNEKILNHFITFFDYLISFIGKERRRGFEVLAKFREKLLGEEHLFRTNIFLYHLEKYFNIKEAAKIDIYELYENL